MERIKINNFKKKKEKSIEVSNKRQKIDLEVLSKGF